MNKAYRSVWNESTGAWEAVQENARGRGKRNVKSGAAHAMQAVALLGLGALALSAQAAETPAGDTGTLFGGAANDSDTGADAAGVAMRNQLTAWALGVSGPAGSALSAAANPPWLAAANAGAGVDTSGLTHTYNTAAYYSQVAGFGNGQGSTPPTDMAWANASGAIAIGSNTIARGTASTALGVQAYTTANDSVALGSGSVANQVNTVSVGNDGTTSRTVMNADGQSYTPANVVNTRRVVNMAAGQADTDAVNAGQLRAVASALGGNAGVNSDGAINRPSYALRGGTFADVGAALQAVDHAAATDFADSVKYDTSAHTRVTLGGGANGTVLSNLANGSADRDAVNVAQLKAAGLNVDTGGNVTNAFVAYDDATRSAVTLRGANGTRIANLAAGSVAASSSDAVNGAQLYGGMSGAASALGGGAAVNADGSLKGPSYAVGGSTYGDVGSALKAVDHASTTALADSVKYDTSAHARVTLGGANGTVLSNVANGSADRDAVNVAQLKAAGLNVDTGGNVTNAFVAYDDATKSAVTLRGANGTRISNLAAGMADRDAVNAGQLRALAATLGGGAGMAADGTITAPAYHMQGGTQRTVGSALDTLDSGLTSLQQQIAGSGIDLVEQDPVSRAISVGANTNGSVVSFAGKAGNRTLTGVAAGAVGASSADAINGAQLYASTASAAAALGGGASVRADGTLSAPSYTIGGATLNNVGAALTNLDGRVAQNTTQITNLQQTITNIAGSVANAVQYDTSAHDKVTLGGVNATSTVKLSNLADALLSVSSTDAVTGAQLYATNLQVASIEQAMQNVSASQTPYVAVNSPNGPATATGANTLAVGGGALASGTSSTALGDNARAAAANAVALGANSIADRNDSVSVGSVGNERQITNVAAGTSSTDAVNLGQLNSAMGGLNNRVDDIDRSARRGIASASALNIVTPYLPGRTTLNAGTAVYRGQAALGIGVSRWNAKGSVNYNLGVSSAGGNSTIVRAGIGIVFGS